MRVISANVNGVRAALRRGGLQWLAAQEADAITLQEVRANPAQLSKALADGGLGHYQVAHSECDQPGRAGVAVLTRGDHSSVVHQLESEQEIDGSGRWLEVEVQGVRVISMYVHTGEAETPRQEVKYRFLDAMSDRLASLRVTGKPTVVTGDLNVAHREVDIKNWKGNRDKAGFLPAERAYLDRWLADGWVDLGRVHGGEGPGPYTWWSWRGKAFDNDAGWRIDYALATPELADRVVDVRVGRAPSYAERWSDHAPVVVDFDPR